jgi:hypothetical protein
LRCRDGFDSDCVRHHSLFRNASFPEDREDPRIAGLSPGVSFSAEKNLGLEDKFGDLSLGLKSPFLDAVAIKRNGL